MSDITINRTTQAVLLLALVGAMGAAVAAQVPEVQRYLKIRSM
jgi:hypothetical protein